MVLKPEKKNVEPKYPNEDGIKNEELNKPLKKWKKIGITAAVLGSLGIMGTVYMINKDDDMIQTEGVAIETVDMFNSRFAQFEGDKIKGIQVKKLITTLESTNYNIYGEEMENIVTINKKLKEPEELSEYIATIKSGKLYEVVLEYSQETGLVKNINIKQVETTSVVNEVKEEKKVSLKKITKEDFIKKIEGIIKWANHNGLA